jgi:hypothetical protein
LRLWQAGAQQRFNLRVGLVAGCRLYGSHTLRKKPASRRERAKITRDADSPLESNRIKRVPVLRDGKLVGIVSRANLVRALAAAKSDQASEADSDDRAIRDKLLAALRGQEWFNVKEWFKI